MKLNINYYLTLSNLILNFVIQSSFNIGYILENKKKIFKQLEDIHNYIVNDENIIPYNRNRLFLWGFISASMFLGFEFILHFSFFYAIFYIVGLSILSSLFGIYFTKKDNIKYELYSFTNNQKFIDINYLIIIIFAIILTYIFVLNNLGYYSYPIWVFLIGFGHINSGFNSI